MWSTALLLASLAQAHKPSDSYLTLTTLNDLIAVRWDVALRDLDPELGLDVNDDGLLTWGEIRSRGTDIAAFVLPQIGVSAGNHPCTLTHDPAKFHRTDDPALKVAPKGSGGLRPLSVSPDVGMSLAAHSDGVYAVLQYRLNCSTPIDMLAVDYHLFSASDPTHRGIVSVTTVASGSQAPLTSSLAVLGPSSSHYVFSMANASRLSTLRAFIIEGMWHIWLGFDHVLFLLTLLLPSVLLLRRPAATARSAVAVTTLDVLRIVTAFTVAHSLTLTLAVLDWVRLPSRLVESGIALTVLLGALNNIRPVLRERRWLAAFLFGLIHGFGFAGALKALQLPTGELAVSLFGFNLGVEIGQLVIVAIFVPIAFYLRDTWVYRVGIVRGGSILIALIAVVWFIERAWDIKLLTP